MNRNELCGLLCLLTALAIGFSNVSAAEKIKKEKLQVFLMLGQSNMVGLANINTFQYLLQEPYTPDFEEVKNLPEVKADPLAERLAYAKAVEKAINLPVAKRTHIYAYGALTSPTGESRIQKEANSPLSIGYGSGYTTIGPAYGFGMAMEEKLDAPILIIKCAWGNTALAAARRPPSAPPCTETAEEKAVREAKNATLQAKAKPGGTEFTPIEAPHIDSPGWCQGTSNGNDGKIYAAKMEALVGGWRENWGRPDLPFYFTQQQSYGEPNPDNVGFADLREAQTLFFISAKNVGMVPQHDLNSARPTGIHYYNKLDPGKRLARWALAHQYGKDIAYTGPLYKSHRIQGNTVRVQFEQRGPGGGLMVASKGMQADYFENPSAYVEPAKETKGAKLKHFRLAGKDRVWHAADAVIEGGEVVVTSKAVAEPVGVQYAYSATPMGANLYNRAGLPAIAFAYFDDKQLFNEDDPVIVAAAKAEAQRKWGKKPYLLPSSLFRDHAVIQRDLPVPVWGHGIAGTEITVVFGDQSKKTVVGEYEQWLVKLDPMPASSKGRDLEIVCSDGVRKTIKDIVVGDVWILTGTRNITSELALSRDPEVKPPKAMPLLREFRIKTKARRFATPRKRKLEIGGDFKYQAFWRPATLAEPNVDTTMAAYHFGSEIQKGNVPIGIVSLGAENPPLTWMSYESMQTAAGFEKQRDDLNLAYPNTDSCKAAVVKYIETLKQYNRDVAALLKAGKELPEELAARPPSFPMPYYNQWASRTETATHTYNFCVSPLTPFAVRGVVWIPGKDNIPEDVSRYAAALGAYAAGLAKTYGQQKVSFVYAQPTAELVEGIARPQINNSMSVEFSEWPKSSRDIATKLGALAAGK